MANELRAATTSGQTLYAHVINASAQRWNGTAFETYVAGNYANYDIAMTEQGASGVYVGNFPTGITISGTFDYIVYIQAGGSPAQGDAISLTDSVDWTGTVSISAATGAMSATDWLAYVLRRGFKRTDKDAEVYESTTDAIQIMRRRFMFDEAEADANTTDTISVAGDFRLSVESDLGLLLGLIMEDGNNAHELVKLSKAEFNELYPDIHVTDDRGYPKHFSIWGGSIYIGPIPDQTSYTYRKNWSRRAGTITSATTGVPFTDVYRDILADLVLSRLYQDLEQFDIADRFMGRFELGFRDSIRRERHNAGVGTFNVSQVDC